MTWRGGSYEGPIAITEGRFRSFHPPAAIYKLGKDFNKPFFHYLFRSKYRRGIPAKSGQ